AFLAKLRSEGVADVVGLGIDEGAALCIDGDGIGRVYPGVARGHAWLVQPTRPPARVSPGQPLEFVGVRIVGIGAGSRLRLRDLDVAAPDFEKIADVHDGRLVLDRTPASAAGLNQGLPEKS